VPERDLFETTSVSVLVSLSGLASLKNLAGTTENLAGTVTHTHTHRDTHATLYCMRRAAPYSPPKARRRRKILERAVTFSFSYMFFISRTLT
jgi:hypothetical protein